MYLTQSWSISVLRKFSISGISLFPSHYHILADNIEKEEALISLRKLNYLLFTISCNANDKLGRTANHSAFKKGQFQTVQ